MKNLVVIGNAQFVVDCLNVIRSSDEAGVRLVVADPEIPTVSGLVRRYCEKRDIAYLETASVNSRETLSAVDAAEPDLMLSAYNMRILKRPLLSRPKGGTVNFHNGPLPKYRGVNIYSWAIINGEEHHGVTWHRVDEGIDTGDILGQKLFPIAPQDTPLTLSRKGFKAGVKLLSEIWVPLIRGEITSTPQDHDHATYYSLKDVPNGGRVDFGWEFDRFERFLRGLNFQPLENPFVYPRATHEQRAWYPQRAVRVADASSGHRAGRVEAVQDDRLDVCIGDCVAGIVEMLDENRRAVTPGQLARAYETQLGDRVT